MIKMIRGVFGLPVNGIVKAMNKSSGPFEAGAEQEARLIRLGLAVRVDGEPVNAETVDTDAPIGFDEMPPLPEGVTAIPEYSVDMKATELREIGAMCGLTFKVGMSKADMVAALDAHIEANMVDDEEIDEDGEPAPVETAEVDAPIGFDEMPPLPEGVTGIPEYSVAMKATELREIGAMCGLTFKVGMTKAEMVAALDAHIEANMVDDEDEDGEPAPVFDASEAVQ